MLGTRAVDHRILAVNEQHTDEMLGLTAKHACLILAFITDGVSFRPVLIPPKGVSSFPLIGGKDEDGRRQLRARYSWPLHLLINKVMNLIRKVAALGGLGAFSPDGWSVATRAWIKTSLKDAILGQLTGLL
ncbi:hypothetical protein CEXT_48281 [Caerostris extrusa]|uniref:Uncharacterized protein n=1 Tax=Caerostris extrusa TaxID=172846 RepID=A0AAV4N0Q2_CAEEX|nr:hypothetical protein CEXT_48281 [Caerostris extrusa]